MCCIWPWRLPAFLPEAWVLRSNCSRSSTSAPYPARCQAVEQPVTPPADHEDIAGAACHALPRNGS